MNARTFDRLERDVLADVRAALASVGEELGESDSREWQARGFHFELNLFAGRVTVFGVYDDPYSGKYNYHAGAVPNEQREALRHELVGWLLRALEVVKVEP